MRRTDRDFISDSMRVSGDIHLKPALISSDRVFFSDFIRKLISDFIRVFIRVHAGKISSVQQRFYEF